jgi:hypothetical protein
VGILSKYWKVFVPAIILIVTGVILIIDNKKAPNTHALNDSKIITEQSEWELGTRVNIDSSTIPGQFKIGDFSSASEVPLDASMLSANGSAGTVNNILLEDGINWGDPFSEGFQGAYHQIDLTQDYNISRFRTKFIWGFYLERIEIQTSTNGTDFVTVVSDSVRAHYGVLGWSEYTLGSPVVARYVRFAGYGSGPPGYSYDFNTDKVEVFAAMPSRHTTGATQIDGGADFWQWDSNTISQTVPTNTSATYRYRTSTDGATWTSWVDSIGAVTSRAGDDSSSPSRYRYLQVEATLTSTDGVHTPTIDQYDIAYHTEIKPVAPTAQTAVVQ